MSSKMMMALVASLLGAAHGKTLCSEYTGTSCKWTPCARLTNDPGDAYCDNGDCKCNWGSCAFGGYCQKPKGCDKRTHGTCRLLPCRVDRGWTDCNDGFCDCQADACAISGKCEKGCEPRTGGTCVAFSCNENRHATCESPGTDYWGVHGYRCVCPEGYCNAEGSCYKGVWHTFAAAAAMNATMLANKEAPKLESAPKQKVTTQPFVQRVQRLGLITPFILVVPVGMIVTFLVLRRVQARNTVVAPEAMLG
mmetsp:Transcript_99305/g.171059  ORF Transcript_99305/g.171059 Transcript_99305/m.171059 type:complete len:251 (+) Transcript_99305:71-823(+)